MKRKLLVLFFFVMLMTAACNVSDEKNSSEETPFSNEEYVCIDSFRQGFLTEEVKRTLRFVLNQIVNMSRKKDREPGSCFRKAASPMLFPDIQ